MACEKVITQKESGRSRRRLLQQYRGKKKTYFPSNLKCSHTKRVLKNSERAFYSWCALPRLRFITWIAQILVLLQVSFTSEQNCLRRVFFPKIFISAENGFWNFISSCKNSSKFGCKNEPSGSTDIKSLLLFSRGKKPASKQKGKKRSPSPDSR